MKQKVVCAIIGEDPRNNKHPVTYIAFGEFVFSGFTPGLGEFLLGPRQDPLPVGVERFEEPVYGSHQH